MCKWTEDDTKSNNIFKLAGYDKIIMTPQFYHTNKEEIAKIIKNNQIYCGISVFSSLIIENKNEYKNINFMIIINEENEGEPNDTITCVPHKNNDKYYNFNAGLDEDYSDDGNDCETGGCYDEEYYNEDKRNINRDKYYTISHYFKSINNVAKHISSVNGAYKGKSIAIKYIYNYTNSSVKSVSFSYFNIRTNTNCNFPSSLKFIEYKNIYDKLEKKYTAKVESNIEIHPERARIIHIFRKLPLGIIFVTTLNRNINNYSKISQLVQLFSIKTFKTIIKISYALDDNMETNNINVIKSKNKLELIAVETIKQKTSKVEEKIRKIGLSSRNNCEYTSANIFSKNISVGENINKKEILEEITNAVGNYKLKSSDQKTISNYYKWLKD